MQHLMRDMAAGLLKELLIELLNGRVLMRTAQLHTGVLIIEGLGAQSLKVGEVPHARGLIWLAAAVDASARARHNFDERVILLAVLHSVR